MEDPERNKEILGRKMKDFALQVNIQALLPRYTDQTTKTFLVLGRTVAGSVADIVQAADRMNGYLETRWWALEA